MAQKKRPYGSGFLKKTSTGWALRWREPEIAPDGTRIKVLEYRTLGPVPKKEASRILNEHLSKAGRGRTMRSRVLFETVASQWKRDVLPMYKHSTQQNHAHILAKHLIPRFGPSAISDVNSQEIQSWVAHLQAEGYAPKTVDHLHDVLSAVLRTAVKWGHLESNPARAVDLPRLVTVRPKWALTPSQASGLLEQLPPLPKTMVTIALLTGVRRGELFALRWKAFDRRQRCLHISEAVYEGAFSTPKTASGTRTIPLPDAGIRLLLDWRRSRKRSSPEDLIFSTRSGKPISPNNVLRRWISPACDAGPTHRGRTRRMCLTRSWPNCSATPMSAPLSTCTHRFSATPDAPQRTVSGRICSVLFSPAGKQAS